MEDVESLASQVERASSRAFTFVPLPWRVILLIGTGILCWATNLHFLHLVNIDTAYVLDVHPRTNLHPSRPFSPSSSSYFPMTSFAEPSHLYPAAYKSFATYASWSFGCWLFFRALCGGDADMIDRYKIIPEICAIGLLAALVCPFNVFQKRERDLFLHGVYRCLFSRMEQPIHFSDVVLADIFTSFAKVIGDLWVSACMLAPWGSLRVLPMDEGWLQSAVPCLMSLPYVIRLRQCLVEYLSSPQRSNKRALSNAIKYATAFPVIFLSAAQRSVISELVAEKGIEAGRSPWHGEHQLFRLWLLAVAVNSGYSFWWDVTNDWGLSLFQSGRIPSDLPASPRRSFLAHLNKGHSSTPPPHGPRDDDEPRAILPGRSYLPLSPRHSSRGYPRGLRPTLLFRDPTIYYIAIALNLILRLTWSLKLSSHLHSVADLEVGIFSMEALELIRRWVWVFFRVEWEAVKKGVEDRPNTHVESDIDDSGFELQDRRHSVDIYAVAT